MSALDQTVFSVPGSSRTLELRRLPERHDRSLRAWDAADEYALAHLAELDIPAGRRWLVVNDLFGALTVALARHEPQAWGDSSTSHQATRLNLAGNGFDPDRFDLVPSTDSPAGPVDVAVIKIPRSLALLEDQLRRLAPLLAADAVVVGAGMTKAIHNSTIERFEALVGPSPTTLARKKARLILPTVASGLADLGRLPVDRRRLPAEGAAGAVEPGLGTISHRLDDGRPVIDHPNVFSRGKLDGGTRAMLDHIEGPKSFLRQPAAIARLARAEVLDLGCGNGLLGLALAVHTPQGRVTFVDESYQAVASARATANAWSLPVRQRFIVDHTLDQIDDGSIDILVTNPPFHAHQSRTDTVALAMFDDARRVLNPGGRLLVVGNRHLGYHRELGRRFEAVETVAATSKFVVLQARSAG